MAPPEPPAPISRRTFLRRTLAGAALLAAGGTIARHLSGYTTSDPALRDLRAFSTKEALILAAIARRMVAPDERGAPSPDEIGAVRAADTYVAGLPEELRADLKALLQLVEHAPFLDLRFARFTHLGPASQDAVLEGWAGSVFAVRRQGFAGLKALVMMGYYGDPRTFAIPGWPGPVVPRPPIDTPGLP